MMVMEGEEIQKKGGVGDDGGDDGGVDDLRGDVEGVELEGVEGEEVALKEEKKKRRMKKWTIHCKEFTAPFSSEECVEKIQVPTQFKCFDESVMNWKKASSFPMLTICLDEFKMGLIVRDEGDKLERYIPIEQISDIRDDPFVDESNDTPVTDDQLERFLSIAHYKGERDLINVLLFNLIASTEETAQIWRVGLHAVVSQNTFNSPRFVYFQERRQWMYAALAAQAEDGKLTVQAIAHSIARDCKSIVKEFLEEKKWLNDKTVDAKLITWDVFEELFRAVYPRPDIVLAFKDVFEDVVVEGEEFSEDTTISIERLLEFLHDTQRDPRLNEILAPLATLDECKEIVTKFETNDENKKNGLISIRNINTFLMEEPKYGFARNVQHHEVYQDMTKPMCHYFVNSSHNTYLTGGQLSSKSTNEIYRQTLLQGCRCLEIDIWDGPDGEPEVTHGRTMCTRIPFEGVIKAIGEYSFVNCEWPVVLSFENHCSPPQMRKMATYCKESLHSLLQSEFLPGDGYDTLPNELPAPSQLKNKIIIKNKKRKMKQEEIEDDNQQLVIDGEVYEEDEEEISRIKERSGEIAKELSDLVNYCTPFHFKNFGIARANNNPYHISSFAEKKAIKLLSGKPEEFIDYNKHQFSRIYPNGTRINSSNYNPQIFWNVGCQFVALNWQTCDLAMQLNHGKFKDNGRSGYILKPVLYTNPHKTFNPFNRNPIDEVVPLSVSVKVVSVLGVAKKSGAPYVEVQFFGIPADSKKHHYKTRPARGKGFSPRWRADNTFNIEKVILPSLVHVRFIVYDSKDDKCLGWECIPLNSLHSGLRYITLSNGVSPVASLFVHFDINIYVMSAHAEFADILVNPLEYLKPSEQNMMQLEDLFDEDEEGKAELQATMARKSTLSGLRSMDSHPSVDGMLSPVSFTKSQSHSLSEEFNNELDDYIAKYHSSLVDKSEELAAIKQINQLKASHNKLVSKKMKETTKSLNMMRKQAVNQTKKTLKSLTKELKSLKKAKKNNDMLEDIVNEHLSAGFDTLLGLELAYLHQVYTMAENHVKDNRFALATKHHESVERLMVTNLKQMHSSEIKNFKKFLNQRWSAKLSEIKKKNKELREDLEKKMKRVAVTATNKINTLIEKDEDSFIRKLEERKLALKMNHKREMEIVLLARDNRIEQLTLLQQGGYNGSNNPIRWGELSIDEYLQKLIDDGRVDIPVFEEAL
eukprot:m.42471 g.42471  ORF g.42471 m.42471 type:complete len:1206 (+) comp10521_c0_seq1:15-3632(+)